jgi:hypothetical protein
MVSTRCTLPAPAIQPYVSPQTVIQTVEWTIKEVCRLVHCTIHKGSFRRRFSPESLEASCFCVPRKVQGYFGRHVISRSNAGSEHSQTVAIALVEHMNPYHQGLVSSNLSDAIHRCERRGCKYWKCQRCKKTESVVTPNPTSCKSKPIPKQRDFTTQRLLHSLPPVPAH